MKVSLLEVEVLHKISSVTPTGVLNKHKPVMSLSTCISPWYESMKFLISVMVIQLL